ncbi:DUF924 family protein [Cupriavidus basilensis]
MGSDARTAPHAGWVQTPEGACARIVVLDQVPRNVFRRDPRSFASDAAGAGDGPPDGGEQAPIACCQRHSTACSATMPFEHSEALADQDDRRRS